MADLHVRDRDLKSLHEALCLAQFKLGGDSYRVKMLGRLLTEVERHRPLGSNGKHGNLHTRTCGCEDVRRPGRFRALFARLVGLGGDSDGE
jgi:hypothetical protein